MKNPMTKTQWTLSHCSECHKVVHFWRTEGHTFRCILCGKEKKIREVDHDRNGLLE